MCSRRNLESLGTGLSGETIPWTLKLMGALEIKAHIPITPTCTLTWHQLSEVGRTALWASPTTDEIANVTDVRFVARIWRVRPPRLHAPRSGA